MRADDTGREALHQAVQAFRDVMKILMEPVPALFVDLSAAEKRLSSLTQELPLVDFSPFGTMPDDVSRHAQTLADGDIPAPPRSAGLSRRPESSQTGLRPPVSPDKRKAPTIQSPVFSLRRSATAQQSSRNVAGAKETGAKRPRPGTEGSTAQSPSHDGSGASELMNRVGVHPIEAHRASPEAEPLSTFDRLADSVLQQTASRDRVSDTSAQNHLEWQRHDSKPASSQLDELRQPLSVLNQLADSALQQIGAVAQKGEASTMRINPSPSVTDAQGRQPRGKALLPPQVEVHRPNPEGAESTSDNILLVNGSPVVRHTKALSVLSSSLEMVKEEHSELEARASSAEGHIDADAIASLINDALVKQARRHGVDLS